MAAASFQGHLWAYIIHGWWTLEIIGISLTLVESFFWTMLYFTLFKTLNDRSLQVSIREQIIMFAHELRLDTLMHNQKRSLTTQLNRHCSCMIKLMRATPFLSNSCKIQPRKPSNSKGFRSDSFDQGVQLISWASVQKKHKLKLWWVFFKERYHISEVCVFFCILEWIRTILEQLWAGFFGGWELSR